MDRSRSHPGCSFAYMLYVAVHNATAGVESGSLHALCSYGAVESLWSLVISGRFMQKIHASNTVLSLGLLPDRNGGPAYECEKEWRAIARPPLLLFCSNQGTATWLQDDPLRQLIAS
ncbi:MAG: hypothetical protein R6X16_02530 [Anaerolineae bacterium]